MKLKAAVSTLFLACLLFVGNANAQDVNAADRIGAKTDKQEYDQNIQIKKKPRPGTGRFCSRSSGTTRLRVTFDKSEKITGVELVVSSGCDSFDKSAIKAAGKIKFKPATKNGEPVTITKLVEYVFTLYVKDIR